MHFIRELLSHQNQLLLKRPILRPRLFCRKHFCRIISAGLFLLACCTLVQAQQNIKTPVSISVKEKTLKDVFKELEQKTGFTINYQDNVINAMQKITIDVQGKPLADVLQLLLRNSSVTFTQQGNMILLIKKTVPDAPQPKKDAGRVSGKILDEETGEPIGEVTIRIGNKGTTSAADGSFTIALPEGIYESEISSIGYGTKQVTEIEVKDNQVSALSVTLKKEKNILAGVVVKSTARTETVAALYVRQRNTAEISNGFSAEQISATPDKNAGEVLKRISGVSTNDNRRVVVRGIAERYNVAMLDGVILPSTDVQVRDFEFDIIPSNLIDNIVVSKGYTPDMGFGFGGGLVQINTLAIPSQDFTSISASGKYNSLSTGKDFLGYKRGKQDYWGFDDGARKNRFPKDLFYFDLSRYNPSTPYQNVVPPGSGLTPITPEMIGEQNKKIGGTERLGTRVYNTLPSQNYQFTIGRNYNAGKGRFGFVGSLSYRNEQNFDDILQYERGQWAKNGNNSYDAKTGEEIHETTARQYNFNTSWAALFNAGWQTKNHKIFIRNFYSRIFQSQFTRISGWGNDLGYGDLPAVLENDSPRFIDLLQNKVSGSHKVGRFTIDWSLSRNKITNHEHDAVEASLSPVGTANSIFYTYSPNGTTNPGVGSLNRAQYKYDEDNLMADVSLSYQFRIGGRNQIVKAGYQYLQRHGVYDWMILPIGTLNPFNSQYAGIPLQHWTPYFDFADPYTGLYYHPEKFSLSGYEGKNTNQAIFGMMDNRVTPWMRIVWGGRIESYVYEEIKNGTSNALSTIDQQAEATRRYVDPVTGELVHKYLNAMTEEKKWRYLPSVNATFTPLQNLNLRLSYAESVVRPSLIENSSFSRYNPTLGRIQRNTGVLSTVIDHYDAKAEWYPGKGEVLSIGYFYKHFDNPVEMYLNITSSAQTVEAMTGNSDWAKVHGWELDLRKNLGFIAPGLKPLQNIFFTGNLTFQRSDVQASTFRYTAMGLSPYDRDNNSYEYREKILLKEKRPLYGQVPVLYNIGLLYSGNRLSLNAVFNHMGYKTFTVGMLPEFVEYERPRNQLDAQVAYDFLKNKSLRLRLNMSNLLDNAHRFFINNASTYKIKDNANLVDMKEWSDRYEWKFGFSEKYEEGYYETSADGKTKTRIGDTDTFVKKVGRSFSLSVSYSF